MQNRIFRVLHLPRRLSVFYSTWPGYDFFYVLVISYDPFVNYVYFNLFVNFVYFNSATSTGWSTNKSGGVVVCFTSPRHKDGLRPTALPIVPSPSLPLRQTQCVPGHLLPGRSSRIPAIGECALSLVHYPLSSRTPSVPLCAPGLAPCVAPPELAPPER